MVISEQQVAAVVARFSARLSEPAFAQERIGGLVETQPNAARFLTLAVGRKLGAEEAMQAVFHASLIEDCFVDAGASLAVVGFPALDAAGDDACAALAIEQPAIADYLIANVEAPEQRAPICRVALAWSRALAADGGAPGGES